jgi:hypothetical protein
MQVMQTVTHEEFAALLTKYCATEKDEWPNVPHQIPLARHSDCEACGVHPLSQANADELNALFDKLKALNAPAPGCVWVQCKEEVFISWYSADERCKYRICLDMSCRSAMVSSGEEFPTYFVTLEK